MIVFSAFYFFLLSQWVTWLNSPSALPCLSSYLSVLTLTLYCSHLPSFARMHGHKSKRPATATFVSSMHQTDLWESIDSAFSLVRLLLLLSWALSFSGPGVCVCIKVLRRLNRMIHTHTHCAHPKSNQCTICKAMTAAEMRGLTAQFHKDWWRSAPGC